MSDSAREKLPLETARDAFQWLVTGPDPLAVDGRQFAGLPRRLVPLDELRDRLMSKQCPLRTRDEVWAYLVRRSRRDGGAWTVACVGMALPTLAATARWMGARYRGDRADAHAAVLAGFLEALTKADLEDPAIVVRLAWAARRAGQAALEESLDAPLPVESGFHSAVPRPPYGHPDLVLAQAVAEDVLTPTEAELISATRLGETSVTEWAREHGAQLQAVFKARSRAEVRLVTWLQEHARDTNSDDPVVGAAMDAITKTRVVEQPDPTASQSLSVSGRRRNGRPAASQARSRSVSKSRRGSRLLNRGDSSAKSSRDAESPPNSEERPCA